MGKAFSHRRPEDKPMYVKPNQLDYEKRSLLVTSLPATTKTVINNIIETHEEDNGMIQDGGSSLISLTDSIAIVIDGGASV